MYRFHQTLCLEGRNPRTHAVLCFSQDIGGELDRKCNMKHRHCLQQLHLYVIKATLKWISQEFIISLHKIYSLCLKFSHSSLLYLTSPWLLFDCEAKTMWGVWNSRHLATYRWIRQALNAAVFLKYNAMRSWIWVTRDCCILTSYIPHSISFYFLGGVSLFSLCVTSM